MSQSPRVSVVLNSYNQARFLPAAIESVLQQTFADFELVAADNGSTDGSAQIISDYAGRDPRVVPLLHPRNEKISKRFNESLRTARGELVSFLYSDDYYLSNKLRKQVEAFDRLDESYGVVYSPVFVKNELTGRQWQSPMFTGSGFVLAELLDHSHLGPINMLAPMARRSLFLRYPFHEDIFTEGEAWFFRAAMKHRFCYVDEPLLVLRDHGGNAGKAVKANIELTEVALAHLAASPDFPAEARGALKRFHARILRNGAWSTTRTGGDMAWVRRAFVAAVALQPHYALHPRTLLGLPMSLLPDSVRERINAVGSLVRRQRGNVTVVEDFR